MKFLPAARVGRLLVPPLSYLAIAHTIAHSHTHSRPARHHE